MKFGQTTSVLTVFTYAIILVLVLPSLVQHGMFMDGMQYACVSRDLALGKGSFWFPHLSDSWFKNGSNNFMEHMPLVYFLQSKFFLVFGESIYTEKIYCFCCLLVSTLLIKKIWNLLPLENNTLKRNSWLPLLLWITCGSVFWAYQNNMLEITVTVFVLASAYFMLKAIYNETWPYINIFISAICIFLSSLSKGLPGLFPIAGIILFYFTCKNFSLKRTLLYSFILIAVPFLIYALFYFFNTDAHESIHFYLVNRLLYRVDNDPLVDNRLVTLFWLFTDMLFPLILVTFLVFFLKFKKIKNTFSTERKRLIAFFILFGFAGVVPLTLTFVQRAVYFIPALPFFAIGLSLWIVNGIEELKNRTNIERHYKKFRYSSFIVLSGVLIACALLAGNTSRDEDMLDDVRKISANIPSGSNVDVPDNVYELWDFQFYLLRYSKIILWPTPNKNSQFYLSTKPISAEQNKNYNSVNIGLKNFELFKKP